MPTLLELSHLPVPEQLQGHSLMPLMAAARDAGTGGDLHAAAEKYGWTPTLVMSEKARTEVSGGPHPYGTEHYALIDGGWKLMHHITRLDGGPEYELFDHKNDPLNQKNVAGENPEIVKQLAAKLAEHRQMAQAAALPDAGTAEAASSEELERLRSLGYVQ
jgi:hypothetical protein